MGFEWVVGPDHDVGIDTDLLNGMLRRGDRLQRAAEVVIDLAQPVQVAVEHVDVGVHPHGQCGCRHARHAGSENDGSFNQVSANWTEPKVVCTPATTVSSMRGRAVRRLLPRPSTGTCGSRRGALVINGSGRKPRAESLSIDTCMGIDEA